MRKKGTLDKKRKHARKIESTVAKTSNPTKKSCNACGGTDHMRKSHRLCKFYNGGGKSTTTVRCKVVKDSSKVSNELTEKEKDSTNNLRTAKENNICATIDVDRAASTPKFIDLNPRNATPYKPVIDVASTEFMPANSIFKVIGKDINCRKKELIPTAGTLMSQYYPEELIEKLVHCSNKYLAKRKMIFPELKTWEDKKNSSKFTVGETYHFIVLLYSFGVLKLPSKKYYWTSHDIMPIHGVTSGMSQKRFLFLWRHFHFTEQLEDEEDLDKEETNEEDENELLEIETTRVEIEQEDEGGELDENELENQLKEKNVWFDKIKPLLDHV